MTVEAPDDVVLRQRDGSRADRSEVTDTRGHLLTMTARRSVTALRSARRRRVEDVGTRLPEPSVTSPDGPAGGADTAHTLSTGLPTPLELPTPVELAVPVLRAVDPPHAETAALPARSPANVRQVHRRARARLAPPDPPGFVADPSTPDRPLDRVPAAGVRRPVVGGLRVVPSSRSPLRKAPPDLRVEVVRATRAPALRRTRRDIDGVAAPEPGPGTGLVRAVSALRNPGTMLRRSA